MNIRQQLQEYSRWAKIVSWVTIIGGGLQALGGVWLFIIGALPGVLTVILGLKLLNSTKHATNLVNSPDGDDQEMLLMIKELTTYFKIQGILVIIAIVFVVLAFGLGILGAGLSGLF